MFLKKKLTEERTALTELFNGLRNDKTPVIVERIVSDIDDIVKIVRFDGWQKTTTGKNEVKKALRSIVWIKYKIKDKDVFDKAYSYIETVLLISAFNISGVVMSVARRLPI